MAPNCLTRTRANSICCVRPVLQAHELWDVTDPAKPTKVSTVVSGLVDTHKNWWECDSGTRTWFPARPVGVPSAWGEIYDLSDPSEPVFIRNFWLAWAKQPGSTGAHAFRIARRYFDRPEGQSYLRGIWHHQERHHRNSRPRQIDPRPEGSHRREPLHSPVVGAARIAAGCGSAHHVSDDRHGPHGFREKRNAK